MSCNHPSMWTCPQCEPPRTDTVVVQTSATVEMLQSMFHDEKAEVRRLIEENALLKSENERLRAAMTELKRKRRKRK